MAVRVKVHIFFSLTASAIQKTEGPSENQTRHCRANFDPSSDHSKTFLALTSGRSPSYWVTCTALRTHPSLAASPSGQLERAPVGKIDEGPRREFVRTVGWTESVYG